MASESVSRRSSELKLTGRFFRGATIVALAGIAGVTAIWWWEQQSPINRGNKALNAAYRFSRPLKERISGFDYASFTQVRSGEAKKDNLSLVQAERFFLDAASDRNPEALHALGRFYLAQGKLKEAGDQFELALQLNRQNAQLHNDQAVLLMVKSRAATGDVESGEEIEELASALEHFNQAIELDSNLTEAVFNRALLFNQMLLPQPACDTWQQYLKLDAYSNWATEARMNLQRIEVGTQPESAQTPSQLVQSLHQARQEKNDEMAGKILSQKTDRVGSLVVRKLIDDLLEAEERGDVQEASHLKETLSYVGALDKQKAGDSFVEELAAFYRQPIVSLHNNLRQAQSELKEGLTKFEDGDFDHAGEAFEKAGQLFHRLGDYSEALLADFLQSRCYRKQSEVGIRFALLDRLAQDCERRQYKWLLAQILIAQITVQSGLANHSYVIEHSRRGVQIAQAVSDIDSWGTLLLQAAESYYQLGNYNRSLALYREGLALIHRYSARPWMHWALNMSIAFPLNAMGHYAAAAEYQLESVRVARLQLSPKQSCLSYSNLGLTYGFQKNYDEAIKQANNAFEAAKSITGELSRKESQALATLNLAYIHLRAGLATQATKAFDQSIDLYEGLDSQEALKYSAHKGRLLSALAGGESQLLEREIGTVLKLFEEYRVRIREESNRNSFFDLEQSIYDIAIDFEFARKQNAHSAFELAERCRARSLRDLVSNAPRTIEDTVTPDLQAQQIAPPLSLAEIQSRMQQQAQLVQYTVLKERLLIWVVTPGRPLVSRERKVSAAELESGVTAYLSLIAKNSPEHEAELVESAQRLYRWVIEPVADVLDKDKILCLSPDKVLNKLPFAALIQPGSSRFLLEEYSLLFTPSATMFVICSEAAVAKENVAEEKLLVVGDPSFDRSDFPLTPYLASARHEAESIADLYRQPKKLIGEQASKRRLLKEMDKFDLLHLALHCVVDARSPMRSKLLLADEGNDDPSSDVLQAYEIYSLPMERLRLVILSACRSGVERYYGGEGMVGISRPFIAKGVPLVVASLWDVDSDATTELMIRFHQFRREPMATLEALRQAELSLMRDSTLPYRHPYFWASFASIGGYARF